MASSTALARLLSGAMLFLPASYGWAQERVSPNELFAGVLLDAHAPDSEGWLLAGSDKRGIAFSREGTAPGETFAAQVFLFRLAESKTPEKLVALIKDEVQKETPAQRFDTVQAAFEYSDARGYPCVRFKAVLLDKEGAVSSGRRAPPKLQVHSLYCRHPRRQDAGFAAIYSHRGDEPISDLDAEALAFIEGVQIPKGASE